MEFELSNHAQNPRMKERNITKRDIINTIQNGEKFDFFHKGSGATQTGFYTKSNKLFIPTTKDGVIPTIFKRSEKQIQKLKKTINNNSSP